MLRFEGFDDFFQAVSARDGEGSDVIRLRGGLGRDEIRETPIRRAVTFFDLLT